MPWRLAFALQADGWFLRSDIIWYKPNCQPESVKDRPTHSHEYIFLLSKSQDYYYDTESVRQPTKDGRSTRMRRSVWELSLIHIYLDVRRLADPRGNGRVWDRRRKHERRRLGHRAT